MSSAQQQKASRELQLSKLEQWLKANHPDDLLAPVKPGTKQPLYAHKDGAWSWARWEKCVERTSPAHDVCFILHDLCVVDVDSETQVAALEARFGEALSQAPCERTRRGRHYLFARSQLADENGYFDGAAQREEGVDFKSIHESGTGGIVLVAPSQYKSWLPGRAPWPEDDGSSRFRRYSRFRRHVDSWAPAPAIPADLLDAVAVPNSIAVDAHLRFTVDESGDVAEVPEELELRGCHWLHSMAFFEALLSGRWSTTVTSEGTSVLDVPCDKRTFVELLSLLDHNELLLSEPTEQLIAHLEQAADLLGLPARLTRRLREPARGRVASQVDLFNICPSFWRVDADAAARARKARGPRKARAAAPAAPDALVNAGAGVGSGTGAGLATDAEHVSSSADVPAGAGISIEEADAVLVPVNAALSATLLYQPLKKDARWLFDRLPCVWPPEAAGRPVLAADPSAALLAALPPLVAQVLREHRSCVALAGGAVTGGVALGVTRGDDFDLFLFGIDAAMSETVLASITAIFAATHDPYSTEKAVSFIPRRDPAIGKRPRWERYHRPLEGEALAASEAALAAEDRRIIQVVLRTHRSRAQILETFDIAPSMALARFADVAGAAEPALIVEALPSWVESLRRMSFWMDASSNWRRASGARVSKYVAKGFECVIPGLRREAFRTSHHDARMQQGDGSLGGLIDAEAEALRSRKVRWGGLIRASVDKDARLLPAEARAVARRLGRSSNYDESLKMQGVLLYVARSFIEYTAAASANASAAVASASAAVASAATSAAATAASVASAAASAVTSSVAAFGRLLAGDGEPAGDAPAAAAPEVPAPAASVPAAPLASVPAPEVTPAPPAPVPAPEPAPAPAPHVWLNATTSDRSDARLRQLYDPDKIRLLMAADETRRSRHAAAEAAAEAADEAAASRAAAAAAAVASGAPPPATPLAAVAVAAAPPAAAPVQWAQRRSAVLLTITLEDVRDSVVTMRGSALAFSGVSRGQRYVANLELFADVDDKHDLSAFEIKPRGIVLHLAKESSVWWPRLLKDKSKEKNQVAADWSRLLDEDEACKSPQFSTQEKGFSAGGMRRFWGVGLY